MVTKGQLLERPVIIPGPAVLDGIYLRGGPPGLVVASPLPGTGGSMTGAVASELAYAAAYAGSASLRLDYRGVGASEGEPSDDPARAAEDLGRGLELLSETLGKHPNIALASYLSGCAAALRCAAARAEVDRLLLVAPLWPEGEPGDYAALGRPVLVAAPGDDPGYDLGAERERVERARNARLVVIAGASRSFREELGQLNRLVPGWLGYPPRG